MLAGPGVEPGWVSPTLDGTGITDLQTDARDRIGRPSTGRCSRFGKTDLLADADVVIDDMRTLAEQLLDVRPPR